MLDKLFVAKQIYILIHNFASSWLVLSVVLKGVSLYIEPTPLTTIIYIYVSKVNLYLVHEHKNYHANKRNLIDFLKIVC